MIGNYQNRGRRWRKARTVEQVNGHDFPGPEVPRAYPYGIYDLGRNTGFVNVGTDHDTVRLRCPPRHPGRHVHAGAAREVRSRDLALRISLGQWRSSLYT